MRAKVAVFVDLYQAREQVRRQGIALREAERANLLDRELRARDEAERLAASLVHADELQRQFLSTLGQELRPPLNAILGWIRMLRDGSIREAQRGRALETVERKASAQLELIEEMIDISRMTSGQLTLELGTVDLKQCVELAIEAVRPSALEKQVMLLSELEGDVAPCQAMPSACGRSCTAREQCRELYTHRGRRHGDSLQRWLSVELAIADTGSESRQTLVPRLFDRFAGITLGRPEPRAGSGWPGDRPSLVELHDGTIRVESGGPGLGCRFVVNLPRKAASRAPTTKALAQRRARQCGCAKRHRQPGLSQFRRRPKAGLSPARRLAPPGHGRAQQIREDLSCAPRCRQRCQRSNEGHTASRRSCGRIVCRYSRAVPRCGRRGDAGRDRPCAWARARGAGRGS